MHHPHDHLFHRVFADPTHAAGLLRIVVPGAVASRVDWDSLRECSGTLLDRDLAAHHVDVLFTARWCDGGGDVLFVIDHKSGGRRFAVLQMLRYVLMVWDKVVAAEPVRQQLPLVVPVLLHHGARPWQAPRSLAELLAPAFDDTLQPDFAPLLLDLAAHGEAAIAGWDLTPLARLCLLHLQFARGAEPDDLERALRRWQPLFVAAATTGGVEQLAVFPAYVLEVTDMPAARLSGVLAELLAPELGERVMSTADKLRAEGRRQGLEEGKIEGKTEGRAEILLRQLQKRFGPAADGCVARLRTAPIDDLDRWALRLLDARSLDDVFAPL